MNIQPGDLVKLTCGNFLLVDVNNLDGKVWGYVDPGCCGWRYSGGTVSELLVSGNQKTDISGKKLLVPLEAKESEAMRKQMVFKYYKKRE